MEGGRARRAIKTPKRFDDEAFETPTKHHSTPKAAVSQESVKATPEPTPPQPPKGIIKVKLTSKRNSISLPKFTPKVKLEAPAKNVKETPAKNAKETPVKARETPAKLSEPAKSKEAPLKPKIEPSDELIQVVDVDAVVKNEVKDTPSQQGETSSEVSQQLDETPLVKPKQTYKPRDSARHREPKVKEHTATPKQYKPREKDIHKTPKEPKTTPKPQPLVIPDIAYPPTIVSRPKTKRPRTPPAYEDVTPNLFLPFWDARTAAEDHDDDNVKELVHCNCGIDEELGLMIQCETCLTWQHAHCLGIENPEDAPDGYTCKACSDPKFARDSRRYAYDQEWLTKGKMRKLTCDPDPIPEQTVNTLKKINSLIAECLQIHKLIHGLKVKTKVLEKAGDDDSDLKLFRAKWALGTDNAEFAASVQVNYESEPEEWRANLREHIKEMEEHISARVDELQRQLTELEKDVPQEEVNRGMNIHSLDSIRNDLETMRRYVSIASRQQQQNERTARSQPVVFK